MTQSKPQQPSSRHHYIPAFYTKQWCTDGRLMEYRLVRDRQLVSRRTAPDGTGYERNLYSIEGLDGPEAQQVEEQFFQGVDNEAAVILAALVEDSHSGVFHIDDRSAWTLFLMSLLHRAPEDLDRLRRNYRNTLLTATPALQARWEAVRSPDHPKDVQEVLDGRSPARNDADFYNGYVRLIMSQSIGEFILNMHWGVVRVHSSPRSLLTSDRPLTRSRALDAPDGHMVLPLSPTRLFVAVRERRLLADFDRLGPNELVRQVNRLVVEGAVRYVYGQGDSQRTFVGKHMATVGQPRLSEIADLIDDIHAGDGNGSRSEA